MKPHFKIISFGSEEWRQAVDLREKILRIPLGSTFSKEELAEEENHIQVIGMQHNKIIATAVLVPENGDMKTQRVVVHEDYRNQNIGSKLMAFCEKVTLKEGYENIFCHARDSAVKFYADNQWDREGDYFDEDGIPHLKMTKHLKLF